MEQIVTMQAAAAQPSLRKLLEVGAKQMASGDAFALIFQQLMAGQVENPEETLFPVQPDTQEENLQGAQMAAEMLFAAPGIMPSFIPSQMQGEVLEIQDKLSPCGQEVNPFETLETFEELEGEKPVVLSQDFYAVLGKVQQEPVHLQMEMNLSREVVREVKQLLSDESGKPAETLDIEALQEQVNSKCYFPSQMDLSLPKAALPEPEQIAAQIKEGILENTARGKNEFIVRLKPEGIGEILVKLSEDKSRITLNIFTASEQTAKLISNEVVSLQNALRPLHAEVQQVTVIPSDHTLEYAAQTASGNQQQFSGQRGFDGHSQQSPRPRFGEEIEFGVAMDQALEEDGLDTYI